MCTVSSGNFNDSDSFKECCVAFICQYSNLFGISIPNNCKQVITFATKVRKPAVGVLTFVIFSGTTWSHTWASLLFSFAVIAAVFNPDSFARRASSILAFVLPVTEIKQYVFPSSNFEFIKSEGL